MSSSGQNITRASILHDQLIQAAASARLLVKDSTSDPSVSEALDTIIADIVSVAERDKDYGAIKDSIQQRVQVLEQCQIFLSDMLKRIESLKTSQISQSEHDGEDWWQRKQKSLAEAFQRDQQEGLIQWLQTYADRLIAWDLDACRKLIGSRSRFPPEAAHLPDIFQKGTEGIEEDDYEKALEMLLYLTQAQTAGELQTFVLEEISRSVLHVFIGRIYLSLIAEDDESTENEATKEHFMKALELRPQDGLPHAALGNYHYFYDKNEEARTLYQQAINLSPTQPDGYIGLGLLFENEKLWDEADDWYEQAIKAVQGEENIIVALSKMLAPITGNVYLQLAQMLREENPELALLAVTHAISAGINEKGDYPERIGYKLKGKILEQLDKTSEAAEAYYEAGRRFNWENETQTAIELLEQANSLNPQHVPIYWELSDAFRMSSYLSESPYVSEEAIKKSLMVWQTGASMELPGVNNSNAYVVRALINEQLSRLPGSNPRDLNWEAISYLERAILLDSQDPSRWAYLGSYHREVGLESNILYDTAKALERDADHPAALDERATALANVGEFGQALDVIAHRKSIEPTTGMDGLKTYVLLRVGRYHEALELLNSLIETDSSELWYRESRGLCYHLLDDPKKAAEDYSWIWEKYDPSNTDYLTTYGWAAYNLGKVEQAIEIFKRALEDVPQDGNLYRNLGLCYLVQNDLAQGEEYLNKGIDLAKNVREMDDLLKMDFTEFKKASKEWHAGAQVLQVLDGASDRARKRRSEVERLPSPEEELRTIEPKRAEQTSSWSGIGIDAGLARLYTEQRPSEALAIYRRLQASRDRFPEARVGLGEVLNGELKKGDGYLKERKPDKALEQFSEILDLALELLPNDQEGLAGVRARLSYTFSIMGNSNNAHAAATQALELCRQIGMTEPGEMLGNIWLSLISDVTQGRAFDNDLKSLEESQLNDWLRTELRAARRVLARLFEEPDQLSAQSDQLATR